jgi:hypothetical protein
MYLSFGAVRTGEAVDPFKFVRSAYMLCNDIWVTTKDICRCYWMLKLRTPQLNLAIWSGLISHV